MWANSRALKDGLRELGYFVGPGESPICAVFAPIKERSPEEVGMQTVEYLRNKGIFVTAVVYPVVPLGLSVFRMIPTAAHTEEDISQTVAAFGTMRDDLSLDLSFNDEETANLKKIYGDRM
jgi:glycine C-acetyltransferase